jgi:hypothetical protein
MAADTLGRTKLASRYLRADERRGDRRSLAQVDLTSIFFAGFWASTVFGNVIVRTPLEKSAATLLRSTLAGSLEGALERAVGALREMISDPRLGR